MHSVVDVRREGQLSQKAQGSSLTQSPEQFQTRVQQCRDRPKKSLQENPGSAFPRLIDQTTESAESASHSTSHNPRTAIDIPALPELEGDSPTDTGPKGKQATPGLKSTQSARSRPLFSPLSPSVYSRNTDGVSILPNDSVISFDGMNDDFGQHEGGSAVIIPSQAVKNYVIGTPSPRRCMDSTRSSGDWKEWLSHEVSELGASSRGDITISSQYTPTAGQGSPSSTRYPDVKQVVDWKATPAHEGSISMSKSQRETGPEATVGGPHPTQNTDTARNDTNRMVSVGPLSTPEELQHERRIDKDSPQLPHFSPRLQSERPSSMLSRNSPRSNSNSSTPKSPRMNERFPYIQTGWRSSSHSIRPRWPSRTATNDSSGTSSLKSKGTSSPKVFSNFSAPSTNMTFRFEPNMRSKRSEEVVGENDYQKENVTPTATQLDQPRSGMEILSPITVRRPKSMFPLLSTPLNCSPTTLAQYTTTAEDAGYANQNQLLGARGSPLRPRLRVQMRPRSSGRTQARPRSAVDLGSKYRAPLAHSSLNLSGTTPTISSPRKNAVGQATDRTPQKKCVPLPTSALDGDAKRMLRDSPWAVSGAPASPRSSTEHPRPPELHIKHSSGTLALNKEPSPGSEERNIASVLEERAVGIARSGSSTPSPRGSVTGNSCGRVTPGQRLAEKFLKERTGTRGSGAGSPVEGLKREDTPAFL